MSFRAPISRRTTKVRRIDRSQLAIPGHLVAKGLWTPQPQRQAAAPAPAKPAAPRPAPARPAAPPAAPAPAAAAKPTGFKAVTPAASTGGFKVTKDIPPPPAEQQVQDVEPVVRDNGGTPTPPNINAILGDWVDADD